MKRANPIIQWWMGSGLPKEHIFMLPEKRPSGAFKLVRIYLKKWIIHPIKRRIAKYYLAILKNIFNLKVIAITGSAGKTTTKEMLKSILAQNSNVVASYKNIDPVYNIPMSILKCSPWTDYLVLEFGVEFPGEMDFYLWLAKPDIGVFLNVYPTHTEFFENAEGVYKEKVKLISSLSTKGVAILNREGKSAVRSAELTKGKIFWFGRKSEVSAENTKIVKNKSTIYTLRIDKNTINVRLNIPGTHFVLNSLAAAATGHSLGVSLKSIKKGLENYEEPEHRMNVFRLGNGALVIDDSYNSNPEAAKATLKAFEKIAAARRKIVVFGDMLELGKIEKRAHEQIGIVVSKMNVDFFIGVGKASEHSVKRVKKLLGKNRATWVKSEAGVLDILEPFLKRDSAVLVKGSRSIGLDELVHKLYEYS